MQLGHPKLSGYAGGLAGYCNTVPWVLLAFVLWGCGGALAAAVVVMVMFVGYCIAVPTLGYCWGTAGYCLQYPGYCLQYPK